MTEILPGTTLPVDPHLELFLRDLPTDTPEETNNSPRAIKRILNTQPHHPNSRISSTVEYTHEYVIINNVPPSTITSDLDARDLIGKGDRIFYHEGLQKLILRVPSLVGEMAKRQIFFLFRRYLAERGLEDELDALGATLYVDHPYSKEPSESWIPAALVEGRKWKWSSVVLEVGYCYERLRAEMEWWVRQSEGQVKVVIILAIEQKGSRPRLRIEQWIPDLNAGIACGDGSQSQRGPEVVARVVQCMEVEESEDGGGPVATGMPLVIRFSDMFLREPRNERETELVISQRDLEQIAERLWRVRE